MRPIRTAFVRRTRSAGWAVAALLPLALVLVAPSLGAPKPSWRCVGGICLGDSRAAIEYRYGVLPGIPSRALPVPGGQVSACFWRCTDAGKEDRFAYYGGTRRPANRLLTVKTCDSIFRLPDGIASGTAIPFGQRWHGYRLIRLEGSKFGWEKVVRSGKSRTRVTLSITSGAVRCVSLAQMP